MYIIQDPTGCWGCQSPNHATTLSRPMANLPPGHVPRLQEKTKECIWINRIYARYQADTILYDGKSSFPNTYVTKWRIHDKNTTSSPSGGCIIAPAVRHDWLWQQHTEYKKRYPCQIYQATQLVIREHATPALLKNTSVVVLIVNHHDAIDACALSENPC